MAKFKANIASQLERFRRDQSGNYAILAAMVMPILVGTAGLGSEYGLWVYRQHAMQSAADSAAVSAATARSDMTAQADAITGQYGFINGANGTAVTVNSPPSSGPYAGNSDAVEVIIQQSQERFLSAMYSSNPVLIRARAVAVGVANDTGCVLALDHSVAGALTVQGSAQVILNDCSSYDNSNDVGAMYGGGSLSALTVNVVGGITDTSGISSKWGIRTDVSPTPDPYAGSSFSSFAGCDQRNFSAEKTVTINPGVYCGGMSINAGAVVTLNPGIYYLDRGSLTVNGGATLQGTGVTLIFTSSNGNNWATAKVNGGATINLTAPTTGDTAGIVFFGDRNMPTDTPFTLNGGSSQTFGGAIYFPRGTLNYSGSSASSSGCTQIIADTITFTGTSGVQNDCSGYGTKSFGAFTAKLVQ